MNNVMIDIETLSTANDAAVISIGAVAFDIDSGERSSGWHWQIDLASAMVNGRVDASTLKWWITQSNEAKMASFEGKLSSLSAMRELTLLFEPDTFVWAKGPSFDVAILESLCRHLRIHAPWSHRNVMCVRTIIKLAKMQGFVEPDDIQGLTSHNPMDDAIYQAMVVHLAHKFMQKNRLP